MQKDNNVKLQRVKFSALLNKARSMGYRTLIKWIDEFKHRPDICDWLISLINKTDIDFWLDFCILYKLSTSEQVEDGYKTFLWLTQPRT